MVIFQFEFCTGEREERTCSSKRKKKRRHCFMLRCLSDCVELKDEKGKNDQETKNEKGKKFTQKDDDSNRSVL